MLSDQDKEQIKAEGLSLQEVERQIRVFEKGVPYLKIKKPCTPGDGVQILKPEELRALARSFDELAKSRQVTKFVPASGAATRMFKDLIQYYEKFQKKPATETSPTPAPVAEFFDHLRSFAFFEELEAGLASHKLQEAISKEDYFTVLNTLLNPEKMNYAQLPKGLIKFHRYPQEVRTALEEHLVEGKFYAGDANKRCRIHITLRAEHEAAIKNYLEEVRSKYEWEGFHYDLSYSAQKPSSQTLAVDLENRPFRTQEGKILFRPGGHGTLLENLQDLNGDIVFIKNIDNVTTDSLRGDTILYKKALGALLIQSQDRVFQYIEALKQSGISVEKLAEIQNFANNNLNIFLSDDYFKLSPEQKVQFLLGQFNRPIRVCGVVKNLGEPGGGPFWVRGGNSGLSCQIVESAQIDLSQQDQKKIFQAATHFNPVDLVCGLRDCLGQAFDLASFMDPETSFIAKKSEEGRALKALELPGLWNGAMARWNTIFVEVPLSTFTPVKTVNDLLRPEHQVLANS